MGEVQRIFNKKMWILVVAAVLANLCLFLYGELGGRSAADMLFAAKQYQKLVTRYQDMDLAEAEQRVGTEFSVICRYAKSLTETEENTQQQVLETPDNADEPKKPTAEELLAEADEGCREMIEYHQSLTPEQQTQMELQMKQLRTKLSYLSGYSDSVDAVIANADNMKRFRIFSKQNSFAYSNILRTAEDFKHVQQVTVTLDNDKGADSFVHYNLMYYIAAALMAAVIYALFDERENGMWQIVHNTPNGRAVLAFKRFLLICGGSFVILSLLYVSTFVASMLLYGGFSDLGNAVQTITDYGKFTEAISKGAYIFRLFFFSWLILCAFSIILWAMFIIFRNRNHTLICTAAFVGVEILIYQKIEVQSVYNAFHYINVVSFLRISDLYSTYINWGFKNYVFSVFSIIMFSLTLLTVIAAVVAVWRYEQMRPETKVSLFARFSGALHRQYQKLFAGYPVVLKELHKLVVTGKGLWAVVAVMLIAAYFSTSGQMTFTDAQKEWDKMYLEHGGKDYTYIENYVQEQQAAYDEAFAALEETAAKYERGEVELKEYTSAVSSVQFQRMALSTIREYKEKLSYAEHIKEEYQTDIWLVSDRGYEEIFGKYGQQRELILILALVTAVMLIVSESIAMEHRTGMHQMIHSAVCGRTSVMLWKVSACILLTVGLTVLVYGIDYLNLYRSYGMPYLSAPALSLTFLEEAWLGLAAHTSILGWIGCLMAVRLVVALLTMTAAIFVSKVIGKKGSRAVMPVVLVAVYMLVWILHKTTGLV